MSSETEAGEQGIERSHGDCVRITAE